MQEISKKLKNHIEKPLFLKELSLLREGHGDFFEMNSFRYSLTISTQINEYGIIEVDGFFTDCPSLLVRGLFDAVMELMHEKTFFYIADLKPREIESYLRDKNHEKSYQSDSLSENFREVDLLCIVQKCVALNIGRQLSDQVINQFSKQFSIANFHTEHLINKIKILDDIRQTVLNKLFKQFQMEVEFTELWHENLYYKISIPSFRESDSLRKFFNKIFVNTFAPLESLSKLNWVAER